MLIRNHDLVFHKGKIREFGGRGIEDQVSARLKIRGYLEDGTGRRLVSNLTVETLEQIAQQTGGAFFQAASKRELELALEAILVAEREVTGYQIGPSRRDIFHYFVGLAFISQIVVMTLRF
ncbi:MAG: hypothetical protein IIB03_05605 [Acidobacteria bacterium]|nr:hypothetical protein [Acidobacteriota bacterium]